MSRDRTLVRASDIGMWAYCHRAWWLAKVQRAPHSNPALLAAGVTDHARHGSQVARAGTLRRIGVGLVVLALLVAGVLLVLWVATL